MNKLKALFLAAPIAALMAVMLIASTATSPTTASAQVPLTATATPRPPLEGLTPGSQCMGRISNLQVGQSAVCELRVINHGPAVADDVTLRFSNVSLTISNFAWRYGPSGPLTLFAGSWAANTNFGPVVDIPVNSQIYATFTVTKTSNTQFAASQPSLCADANNYAEKCSTGGAT